MTLESEDLTGQVIGVFYGVYNDLGAGFVESVYQRAFSRALSDADLATEIESQWELSYRGAVVGTFRLDLVVERTLIVECKACDRLIAAHEAQTLNYLAATGLSVGLLFNFGPRPSFKRLMSHRDKRRQGSTLTSTRMPQHK